MKGEYVVSIWNNKIRYELKINRQITVIKGKSGTGKSTLYELFEAVVLKGRASGVHCNCADKIVLGNRIGNKIQDFKKLRDYHEKIFIFDEDAGIMHTVDFARFINNNDNYFIFITRSGRMNKLTYSVNDIYELQSVKDENGKYFTRMYQRYTNEPCIVSPDLIVTEDSNSGFEMFKLVFDNYRVISGHGRDNVYNTLCAEKFKSAYIIVDGAAFGSSIGRIFPMFDNRVHIFAPESFEYLLLCDEAFKHSLTDELDKTWNYCDSTKFISWERYYTSLLSSLSSDKFDISYTKSHLHQFFKVKYFIDYIRGCIPDTIV